MEAPRVILYYINKVVPPIYKRWYNHQSYLPCYPDSQRQDIAPSNDYPKYQNPTDRTLQAVNLRRNDTMPHPKDMNNSGIICLKQETSNETQESNAKVTIVQQCKLHYGVTQVILAFLLSYPNWAPPRSETFALSISKATLFADTSVRIGCITKRLWGFIVRWNTVPNKTASDV